MDAPTAPEPLALLRLQVEALFRHDARGRITTKNKSLAALAPRLFLGRSTGGNVWRLRDDVPDALADRLERILEREPTAVDLAAPPLLLEALLAELAADAPVPGTSGGPAWLIPADLPALRSARILGPGEGNLLRPHLPILAERMASYAPCAAVVEDGAAVAVCFSARISPHVSEAGTNTAPAYRGRGHSSDAVAAWAAEIRRMGKLPLYSTSWDNAASRRVAEKLAMVMYAVDLSIF